MNLLSARRLHSYLLPTEHLNPHLGDPLMSHVPIQRRENKEEKGSCTPPLSFLQYLVLPPLPCPLLSLLPLGLLAGSTAPGLQSEGQASLVLTASAAGHTQDCASL